MTRSATTPKLELRGVKKRFGSKVVLDGRPLGSTPKVGVSVSAGSHTVTFITADGKKSVTVQVKAGETKTAAVKF